VSPPRRTAQLNPPKQSRSRRTLERIVAASLEILATEGPAALTVHAVVDKADSSVGSFYARFKGKDDLLDYLGERVWQDALERWNAALASREWGALELPGLVDGAVTLLIDAQRSRSVYLRALDRASRRRGDAYSEFRQHLMAGLAGLLLERRAEIGHPDPERAVRIGLRAVLGAIEGELRSAQPPDRSVLALECRTLLMGYLGGAVDPGPTSEVDFFDVWG